MHSINDTLSFRKDVAMVRNGPGKPAMQQKEEPVQRHRRTLFSVPMTLQYLGPGGIHTTRGISLDISESGIGALVQRVLRVEEAVGIEFELEGNPLRTVAIVRYSSSVRSGFEFVGLTVEERARVASFVGSC